MELLSVAKWLQFSSLGPRMQFHPALPCNGAPPPPGVLLGLDILQPRPGKQLSSCSEKQLAGS